MELADKDSDSIRIVVGQNRGIDCHKDVKWRAARDFSTN
jgi:phosphoribosyl-AMP cyclohydrolase